MNTALNALAFKLANQDITREEGLRQLMQEGKNLIPSIGFEPAVDAYADAADLFEQQHEVAANRRLRDRNTFKGFRFIPKLG